MVVLKWSSITSFYFFIMRRQQNVEFMLWEILGLDTAWLELENNTHLVIILVSLLKTDG